MHLKRLEISGFKSFADTIKLDFEAGITAVVGPNGCGKSNIIDAIRWSLGEMSAKSLRSSQMMDVVFNGSGARPPQNMAEVTLTFDNTDKRLPIDFSDVSITRRLFRSGESEYFINKTQCRLRDIKELFLDTGMGEDGYSSLEQGKVEWILQAKPEERRELFEEAAGVSKYRARREEALRKLERVEVDLSRLADIINVTADQIRKLENAVTKAKTYERVRGELRTMEISDWLFQLSQSDTEAKEIHEKLSGAQQAAEQLNTQAHQLDSELSEHRLALTQLEAELLQANTVLNGIDSDIKIGEERLAAARRREQELERQCENIRDNIAREEGRVAELKEQQAAHGRALEALASEGSQIETDYATARDSFDGALANLETKKKEVKEARDMILDRAQERARTQHQISQLASDVARLTSQAENIQKERNRSEALASEARASRETAESRTVELQSQLEAKRGVLESISTVIQTLTREEDDAQAAMLERSEDIAKLKGQIVSIRDQQQQDPYLAGSQAALGGGFAGVYGPIGRLFQCDSADRDLVAATLGEHLGDLVAETTEEATRVVDFLRESGKGRVRVWILDRLNIAGGELLGEGTSGTTLATRLRCEDRFRPLLNHLCASLWVQGTNVYGRAFINGGVEPSKWQSHVLHRLPELERSLEEKEAERLELERRVRETDAALAARAADRDHALKEMEEVRIRLELANSELERFTKRLAAVQDEQQVIERDLAQIHEEKSRAHTLHETSLTRFNELQSREKDDHDQLDLLQQELTELQHGHARLSAELAGKEERHRAFQEKLNWQKSLLAQADRDAVAIQQSLDRHKATLAELAAQIEESKAAQTEASTLVESSLSKRDEAASVCAAIQSRRAELSEKVQSAELTLSSVRSEFNSWQAEIQNELVRETTLKSRCESLVQKLHEQYELDPEGAKQQFQPTAADAETLDRLKKRVANMGPINLAAPQEHAELVEKNTFLVNQQNDLIKAKDDIKQVIQKINATTRDHFRETFEKVRENFRALYSRLFQGGEADLRFTDESDILNTGIDIFCQPPGKKLLHISLLSGGEKALTAIALLFAFFQVRPSPIALMDEVDAPLDEANVLRYVDMLKTFSENSQFILISHNKRTMEAANTLYGVTMEELGVSKVLSARLHKAKEKEQAAVEAASAAGA